MKRIRIPVIAAVFFAAGYIACCMQVDQIHMLPNTVVNGMDISGMDKKEAVELLKRDAVSRQQQAVITVNFAGKDYRVDAGDALQWDYESVVEEGVGQGTFLVRGFSWLWSVIAGNHHKVAPMLQSRETLKEAVEKSGILEAGTTTQTSYQVEGDRLIFTMGKSGEEADAAALLELLTAALLEGDAMKVECPVSPGKVKEVDLERLYRKLHRKPENASLDPEHNYRIVEAVTGVDFDKNNAKKVLEAAEEGGTAEIGLILQEPEITTEDLKEHLFADKLASYTTQVGGTGNRKHNIGLAAEACNGAVLLNGTVFSYNDTVGEQTAETGYQPANATMDGKLVQAYGGGICQVSSTIFAAALYADLEIEERWEHEYVPRYIGAGIDAAVAWGVLDLKIRNDKKYPVRIDVVYEDGVLTVDIWGTKTDDTTIEIETKEADTSKGHTVQTYRKVFCGEEGHAVLEKVAFSTYLN